MIRGLDRWDESVRAGWDGFSGGTLECPSSLSIEAGLSRLAYVASLSALLLQEISKRFRMNHGLRGDSGWRLRCFLRPRREPRGRQIVLLASGQSRWDGIQSDLTKVVQG